ncbi:hypothetical protein CFP56_005444 [Quercus suber]|uniref:Uncharacterized protein n=1 Tax=Quercus suber TaxID=58331 RepID=A0AAW0LAI8_QUESU
MASGSVIYADCTINVPLGSDAKSTQAFSKELKLKYMPKGKKVMAQSGKSVTKKEKSLEWKIIKNMELETTKQKSDRGSFSFNEASMEIKEFKAGGSAELRGACLNPNPPQLSTDSEKGAALGEVVMIKDSGYGFKADGNNNMVVTPQEAGRPPLVEISTNKHEAGVNHQSSSDGAMRNISKANLKRIDPKIHSKNADRDGEALLFDMCDAVDPGISSNHQGVDLT